MKFPRLPVCLCIVVSFLLPVIAAQGAEPPPQWKAVCSACHGQDGRGKTKAGRLVGVKDFSDPEYQGSFSDERAAKSIKEGTADENGKPMMLPFGSILSDDEVKALIAHIRALASS